MTTVFAHSSDELYGADRMLLAMVEAMPDPSAVEVWLPTDLPHPPNPLCRVLEARGFSVRHVDLPVLRRAYRTPAALARLAVRAARTTRLLRAAAPSVVYCTSSAVLPVARSARRARVGTVVLHVQEIWSRSDARLLAGAAARCDGVIAISRAVAAALPARVAGRTTVVENGTDDPGPTPELTGRHGPISYLVASRWNGWKGHRTLLRAWELAGCPGELVVLGGPPPSGDAVDVRALVAALPRPDSVTIVGEVADPRPFVAAADVAVMPSEQPEPFGLVAIEAFAAGRPVLASAAGGLRDIVDGTDAGWLFPPGDDAALAQVLRGITRAEVVRRGGFARTRYEHAYTLVSYRERWRAALETIVERQSGDTS